MFIVEAILPVIIIALLGYLAVRLKVIRPGDNEALSRFVFNIALPVLLFDSLAHVELPVRLDWEFLLSYYSVILMIFLLGMWLSGRWFSTPRKEQGIFGLGASYSNLILVGLPVILTGLGEEALLPLFLIVSVHSAFLFLLTTFMVEGSEKDAQNTRQLVIGTGKSVMRNPIVISITMGLIVNLLDLQIPGIIDEVLSTLSLTALPCALIVLGAALASCQLKGHFKEASLIVGLKLLLQPFLIWILVFQVFDVDPLWATVAVMAAGMPVGINAYIFAQNYHSGVAVLSTAVLLSTVLAIFSQSIWLLLLT